MSLSNPTPGSTTYTIGSGVGSVSYGYIGGAAGSGSVTISADEIKAVTGGLGVSAASTKMFVSTDGGEPHILFQEVQGDGSLVKALFEPDGGMSVSDLAKIMSLITVMKENNSYLVSALKPITYIRKHNLERHFRFSAA